jgi:putative membrane protein
MYTANIPSEAQPEHDRFWRLIIMGVSAAVCGLVALLMLGPRPQGIAGTVDVSMLPAVNAALNAAAGVMLLVGFACIRMGHLVAHRRAMLTAFACSTVFLVTYVIYHTFQAGPKLYAGEFVLLYRAVLVSHIVLATVILPLALWVLYLGLQDQRMRHRRLAKIVLPLWLYVSATGVVIYAMLY